MYYLFVLQLQPYFCSSFLWIFFPTLVIHVWPFNMTTPANCHAYGLNLCFKRPRPPDTYEEWHAFYMKLKFLGRNEWLCPWSGHWTLFNVNMLFKSASFASEVAWWVASELMGRLGGPEWSSWLLFISHDCWLPRIKTWGTTWQGRGVSFSPLVLKL